MDEAAHHRPIVTPGDGVTLFRRAVPPELAADVVQITGYRETGAAVRGMVEMAPLVVPLTLSFGEPFAIGLGRPPGAADAIHSFTAGLFPGHVVIDSTGGAACVQIDFTPIGASRFFGLPLSALSGRMIALDTLDDPEIRLLTERIADLRAWGDRLAFAERFVRARLLRAPGVAAELEHAWSGIMRTGGRVRVDALAARIGWSRKHLAGRFADAFGLTPKTAGRMARFSRTTSMIATSGLALADIAAEAGYADQAHLTREFQQFAGQSPAAWRAGFSGAPGSVAG